MKLSRQQRKRRDELNPEEIDMVNDLFRQASENAEDEDFCLTCCGGISLLPGERCPVCGDKMDVVE